MNKALLAARVSGRALMLAADAVDALALSFEHRSAAPRGLVDQVRDMLSGERHSPAELGERVRPVMASAEWVSTGGGGGYVLAEDLAVVDIVGVLWDRGLSWWADGLDAYDVIAATVERAAADERVERILLRISSPGGLVEGLYDACSRIERAAARNGGKHIIAFVGSYAASAAYALAASGDLIVSAHEGMIGSVGAIVPHFDDSEALAKAGIKVSVFRFGEQKAQGEYEPLNDQAAADRQAQINHFGEMFVDLVDRGRPAMDRAAILATQARVFVADHSDKSLSALALGLVDQVMHESELISLLTSGDLAPLGLASSAAGGVDPAAQSISPAGNPAGLTSSQTGETDMDKDAILAALGEAEAAGEDGAAVIARIRGLAEQSAEADTAGANDGGDQGAQTTPPAAPAAVANPATSAALTVDASVAQAVVGLDEAKGRSALANVLAFTPGMTVETAKAALAAAPKEVPGFPGEVPDPAVAADGGDGPDSADSLADRAVALAGLKR